MTTIYGFDVPFSFSDLVVIGYLLIHFFLLFLLTLCACERGLKCCDWIKKLWITGGIYSPLIVQFCDQATDLGVLILWFELAIKERNDELDVEHVNMTLFFGISAICIFIYRIVIIIAACMADNYDGKRCFPLFLSFFDLLFIYEVYFAQSHGFDELSEDMRTYQLLECVFESIPQIILQSVFVLRVWPNREETEIDLKYEILLISSIILSLLNICNKYKWRDLHHQWVDSELCSKMNLRIEKCCCHGKCCSFILFSKYWFLHGIWRFVHILARIVLLVLLWSVLGGALLSLFLLLLFLSFIYCFQKYEYVYIGPSSSSSSGDGDGNGGDTGDDKGNGVACKDWFFAALISFITTHVIGATSDDTPTRSVLGYRMLLRLFEYVIGLALIWSFINFSDTLDCPKYVCSSVENRDWDNNEMIKIYVYIGFGAVGLDFFTFILMYSLDLFQISDGSDGNDDTFGTSGGAPSPVMKVQTSEVDRDDDDNNNTNNVGGDNGNLNAPNFVTTASASSVPQQFEFAMTQQQQQQQQQAQQQQEEQDEEQGTNDDDDDNGNDDDDDDNGNDNNNDDNDDNDDDMKMETEKETAGGDVAIGAALDNGNEPQMQREHDSQHDDDNNNNNDNDIELAIQDKTYKE